MQEGSYGKTERKARGEARDAALQRLGYQDYAAYLQSSAWRDVRERYKASDLPQICMCGAERWQLHHTTYERVGRELLEDLIPLCGDCHATAHMLEREGIIGLDLVGFYYDPDRAKRHAEALALIAAMPKRNDRRRQRHKELFGDFKPDPDRRQAKVQANREGRDKAAREGCRSFSP